MFFWHPVKMDEPNNSPRRIVPSGSVARVRHPFAVIVCPLPVGVPAKIGLNPLSGDNPPSTTCWYPGKAPHHVLPFRFPPLVNRHISCNTLCYSEFLQIARYTCGNLAAANVPQNALSPWCVFHMPSQVNRPNPCNHLCSSAFMQIDRFTCGNTPAGNAHNFRGFRDK